MFIAIELKFDYAVCFDLEKCLENDFHFPLSWNWNIFTATNTFEHSAVQIRKVPALYYRPAVSHKLQFYLH